jgi:hypothetical protein
VWYDQTVPDLKSDQQPVDLDALLSELSTKIERVKQLYEQYFMGIEKIEPQVPRKEVARAMLALQQQQIRNTGLRFRFNTMLQKWNIYITYWNRTLREIDAGTYLKHVAKARRAAERAGKELPEEITRKPGRTPSRGELPALTARPPSLLPSGAPAPPPASRPAAPPPLPSAVAAPPVRKPAAVPGMNEGELRALHQKYVDARRTTGEATVSYEMLVNSLARQAPKLLEQPGVRGVRFDVAVQNGKAVLKAIPQK